ncbi:hypothetical protein ACEPAF_8961 [Sanghuangporus sanghuang]
MPNSTGVAASVAEVPSQSAAAISFCATAQPGIPKHDAVPEEHRNNIMPGTVFVNSNSNTNGHLKHQAHMPSTPLPDEADAERMHKYITDRRVVGYDPLIQPALIRHEIISSPAAQATIARARFAASRIIAGEDERIIVVVGPCSIHCPQQAIEYAKMLKEDIPKWDGLLIIMRSYLNPGLPSDGKVSLTTLTLTGPSKLTKVSEWHGNFSYIADLISWGAIGARTTESQLHRELASGVSFPIGFKNGTDGSVGVAVDAMRAASAPHAFMGVTEQGLAAIVKTRGNQDVHVILRGGSRGTNYDAESVQAAAAAIKKARPGLHPSLMVDCSHGNSQKNHNNQPKVVHTIAEQLRAGESSITGVMIESNIRAGRQDVPAPELGGAKALQYGVSITDACVDYEVTRAMLDELNDAVRARRALKFERGVIANGLKSVNANPRIAQLQNGVH